jgi:hypothetical protein
MRHIGRWGHTASPYSLRWRRLTVFIIATATVGSSSFPQVAVTAATKLLGSRTGVVSGAALLVDIPRLLFHCFRRRRDISFAADRVAFKVASYSSACLATVMNVRGVKESVTLSSS